MTEFSASIRCSICGETVLAQIYAETKEELEEDLLEWSKVFKSTPCSKCVDPAKYAEFLIEMRKGIT